jgi:hypothetical protein
MYAWLLAKSSGNTELQVQESINFDLGATVADTAPDSASHWWNSTMYGHHNTMGVVVPFARISTGRRTSVSLAVTAPFGTAIANGLTTGTPFDANIGNDGWITLINATATSNAGAVTIEGLIPGAKYRLEIFASNNDNDGNRGRSARYEVSGATRDLEAYNNATNTAVFASVTADQYGEVTVKTYATPGTSSRYGQINTLQVTAIVNADIVLSQNFQSSTNVTTFVEPTSPSTAQFNDIGASSAGGTWTVNGSGQLQIVRVGGASGVNGAGLSRWTDFAGSPAVLKMSLDLGTTINSFQNDLLSIEIGRFNGAIGYNNAPAATDLFARINVDGSTPNNIKFEIGGVQSAAFPANGTMHSLTIFLNKSGVARAYTAPDGSTPTLDANRLSVWVGTACPFPNVAASNGSSSALTDFRIRLGTPDTGTWKFDNFHAENNF